MVALKLFWGMCFEPGLGRQFPEASRDGVHENLHNEQLSIQAAEAIKGS